jgi:hypothetical protein
MSCPKCHLELYDGDARCGGCGATLDFSPPAGTVQTDVEEITTTETVWSNNYGYVSYGWLDPWDPFVDAMAFAYLFQPMWGW